MRYILDTTILIGLERGYSDVVDKIDELIEMDAGNLFYTTTLNIAEFYYGYASKSPDAKKRADNFLGRFKLLTVTGQSARIYAELAYRHDRAGAKLGHFDLLTAAIAIDNRATIITTDTDFEKIEELKKEMLEQG